MSLQRPLPLAAVCSGDFLEQQAAELWTGCDFGCRYCLPVAHRWAKRFPVPIGEGLCTNRVEPRTCDPLNLKRLAYQPKGTQPPAFLSLMSDPYPAREVTDCRTRRTITLLHRYGVGARVLTKSGSRAIRDFQPRPGTPLGWQSPGAPSTVSPNLLSYVDPLPPDLGSHPDDAFGATLTFVDETESRAWEPRAALPGERIAGLREAHRRGIPTWVSLNPVIDPAQSLELVRLSHGFVDLYMVGTLMDGVDERASALDWPKFAAQVTGLCKGYGVACYVMMDGRRRRDLEAFTAEMDRLVSTRSWRGVCQARKPKWATPKPAALASSLAETCLLRYEP
jgi:hypothetical protein